MFIGTSCTVDKRSHATAAAQTLGTVLRPAREPARVAAASTAVVANRGPACAARGGVSRHSVGSMVRCSTWALLLRRGVRGAKKPIALSSNQRGGKVISARRRDADCPPIRRSQRATAWCTQQAG